MTLPLNSFGSARCALSPTPTGARRTECAWTGISTGTTKAALLQNKTLALRSLLRPTPSSLTPERTSALDKHLGECIDGRLRGMFQGGRHPRSEYNTCR